MHPIYTISVFIVMILAIMAGNKQTSLISGYDYEKDNNVQKKIIAIIIILYLSIVGGLRYFVGTDYGFYYRMTVSFQSLPEYFGLFKEPGIRLLSAVGQIFYKDGISTILICELVTVSLYVWTIYKYSPMFSVSILLYILMGEWTGSFNGVRQYLAAAILFAGHRFMYNRQFFKYCIVVFVASLFHTSAVIMMVPYFLYNRKPDIKQFIILATGAFIISISYNRIFSAIGEYKNTEMYYEQYAYYNSSVNIFRIMVAAIPVIIYFIFCKKDSHSREEDFYINGLFFNAFTMIAASGSTYLARAGIYTAPIALIGYAYMFKMFRDKTLARFVIALCIVLFFMYYWFQVRYLGYQIWFDRYSLGV